jgi:hypothetical protein
MWLSINEVDLLVSRDMYHEVFCNTSLLPQEKGVKTESYSDQELLLCICNGVKSRSCQYW